MAEKESLMAQYKSVAEQKAKIDQEQEPLLRELNEIKKQIEAFDGRRQEAQVRKSPLVSSHQKLLTPGSRLGSRKLPSSDWPHRTSSNTGRKSSSTRKRKSGTPRNSWTSSSKSLRQALDAP